MKNFGRIVVYLLIAGLIFTCNAGISQAAINDNTGEEPMASNYRYAVARISISESGTATVSGTIDGYAGKTTKTSINLYLQKYTDGSWVNVEKWSKTKNSKSCSLTKTKSVSKGYKYRAKAVFRAYAGSNSEKVTRYSSTAKY